MNMAFVRIALRYGVGAVFIGAPEIGDQLSTDPDLVMFLSGALAAAIEGFYFIAKKKGWAT